VTSRSAESVLRNVNLMTI